MLTPEFMDGSHHGDVTNAGAMENSDALIAALETAYGVRISLLRSTIIFYFAYQPPLA
jgi:hypothetical protein